MCLVTDLHTPTSVSGADTEGDVRWDSNEPTALRARFGLAAALPAGRVGRRTVADDTLKRLWSQDTGLLNPAYVKFLLGFDEWVLPFTAGYVSSAVVPSAGDGFTL